MCRSKNKNVLQIYTKCIHCSYKTSADFTTYYFVNNNTYRNGHAYCCQTKLLKFIDLKLFPLFKHFMMVVFELRYIKSYRSAFIHTFNFIDRPYYLIKYVIFLNKYEEELQNLQLYYIR